MLRKLKTLAIEVGDHEMEVLFFAQEMRAKRRDEMKGKDKPAERFWNYVYEITSNYGMSVLHPSLCLFIIFCLFTVLYKVLFAACDVLHIVSLSFKSLVPFTGGIRMAQTHGCYQEQMDLIVVVTAIESIFGTIFLFLILLGFRNKFKIK